MLHGDSDPRTLESIRITWNTYLKCRLLGSIPPEILSPNIQGGRVAQNSEFLAGTLVTLRVSDEV